MAFENDEALTVLDSLPDAIVIVDSTGRIVFVNVETEAMFQYRRAEIVGQPVDVLLPERFRRRHEDHVARYTLAPRRRPMGSGPDLAGRRRDGEEFPVEISLSPVATPAGSYVSTVIRDATARVATERSLVQSRELAEAANRAKSEFLAAASHDLRQPLQALMLLSKVLTRTGPLEPRAAAAVANQTEALRIMSDLLNALLDVSKLDAGVVKPDITDFSVSRVLSRLRAEFTALAESKGLALVVEDSDTFVHSDPALLSRIIQNLIGNAIRYTRRGGVSLSCFPSGDWVRIDVRDTGVGIPANELDAIFDDFHRASAPAGSTQADDGMGLGLAIARRMAGLLGCSLKAESELGRGSCFSLTVPRAAAEAACDPRDGDGEAEIAFPDDAFVLIVDDDHAVAHATSLLLSSLGLDCVAVPDSARALEALANRGQLPDLLICDFHLSRTETGVDAIRKIREAAGARLPAVLVSGDTSAEVASRLTSVEACHLFSKPVDTDALLALSARLIREHKGQPAAGA